MLATDLADTVTTMGAATGSDGRWTAPRGVVAPDRYRVILDAATGRDVTIAARLGMSTEALRRWVRQAKVDAGQAAGVTSESAREIRELKRKNAELEQTIEILKAATSFLRECDPPRR